MIYFIQEGINGSIKIGFSNNPHKRLSTLQTSSSKSLYLIAVLEGDNTKEQELHNKFIEYRDRGEWFLPHTDILNFIDDNCKKIKTKNNIKTIINWIDVDEKLPSLKEICPSEDYIEDYGEVKNIELSDVVLVTSGDEIDYAQYIINWSSFKSLQKYNLKWIMTEFWQSFISPTYWCALDS